MMKNTEMLYGNKGARRLDDIARPLAETYKIAFAGEPWYEASKCENEACERSFSGCQPGEPCFECGNKLTEAYDTDELSGAWRTILADEDGAMEVDYENGGPIRATLVRPTTPDELYRRKYLDVPAMEGWVQENFDENLVWIEDTFADRDKSPRGNLKDRGRTLGAISLRYGGLAIATRTLAPAVVAATLRDVGENTTLYKGSEMIGVNIDTAAQIGSVPDRRTILSVEGLEA